MSKVAGINPHSSLHKGGKKKKIITNDDILAFVFARVVVYNSLVDISHVQRLKKDNRRRRA